MDLFTSQEKRDAFEKQVLGLIGEGWYRYIGNLFLSPHMRNMAKFVAERRKTVKVYPKSENVFRAFKLTPYQDIKVVILGQDPYHNGSADGLAFSTGAMQTPKSLQVIFNEIARTHPNFNPKRLPDLQDWAKQGVLLLNTVLTVESGDAGSHTADRLGFDGWELFTGEVIQRINKYQLPLVFVLWGAKAKTYSKYIDKNFHLVLESGHPASGFYGTDTFKDNDHFKKIDEFLIEHYGYTIKW